LDDASLEQSVLWIDCAQLKYCSLNIHNFIVVKQDPEIYAKLKKIFLSSTWWLVGQRSLNVHERIDLLHLAYAAADPGNGVLNS
jgi:hypothetical protein